MSKQDSSARVAHILGNYEIFDELGRGGMGIVYRGLDLSLDRPVAVKVLRDELRMQSMIVNRFAREARAAAALDHPNIVQIYTVGESNRTPYIAMELVEAEPLSALMIRDKRIAWERSLAIAEQVADALVNAHDAQIIHRDVKPPNILLTDDDRAYVTDFGIAKILSMHDQLTLDGTKLGTPQYMSPERCKTGDATASSDIYSLGVVLFQMISGRLPYEGATAPELIKRITSQPPARLSQYAPDVPEDIERLVAWFIERRPEQRPATAEQAREAIERVREGKPLDTMPQIISSAIADFRDESRKRKRAKHKGAARPNKKTPVRETKRHPLLFAGAVVAAAAMGWLAAGLFNETQAQPEDATADLARWYASKNAAAFLRESDTMWIAHLADPALRIEHLEWGGRDGALLLTTKHSSDGENVARAMLAVDPVSRFAHAAATQLPDSPNATLRSRRAFPFAFAGNDWDSATLIRETGSAQQHAIHEAITRTIGERRLDRITQIAVHPFEPRVAAVVSTADGQTTLYEGDVDADALVKVATALQLTAAYSGDGAMLVFATPEGIRAQDPHADSAATLVWEGRAGFEPGALHPSGLCLLHTTESAIVSIALDGTQHSHELGPGAAPQWLDHHRFVFFAKDARDALQVWVTERENFDARQQLSFIEGGLKRPMAVSNSGDWLAAVPEQADSDSAVVLLKLPEQS